MTFASFLIFQNFILSSFFAKNRYKPPLPPQPKIYVQIWNIPKSFVVLCVSGDSPDQILRKYSHFFYISHFIAFSLTNFQDIPKSSKAASSATKTLAPERSGRTPFRSGEREIPGQYVSDALSATQNFYRKLFETVAFLKSRIPSGNMFRIEIFGYFEFCPKTRMG